MAEARAPDLAAAAVDGRAAAAPGPATRGCSRTSASSAAELVELRPGVADDPGAVVADIGEACGFDEQLDALR